MELSEPQTEGWGGRAVASGARGWDTLDLVPRGHPMESLGGVGGGEEWRGMDQKTGCKEEVMGTDID